MNKKIYKTLCDNFNKEINIELYEIWKDELKDYDEKLVEQAIKQIIMNDKYMPTLARIVEVIKALPPLEKTEAEKIERWEKQGIHPSWLDKTIAEEKLTDEELAELESEMIIFE